MEKVERRRRIQVITRRLIILAALSLLIAVFIFSLSYYGTERLMLTWLVFECGIIGGFVSIQQRLKNIQDDELFLISESWFSILLVPVYGGIFALVLYILFLSGLLGGQLFPQFYVPPFSSPPTAGDIQALLLETQPKAAHDLPKLVFWAFAAGFSERLVPQIIQNFTERAEEASQGGGTPGDR